MAWSRQCCWLSSHWACHRDCRGCSAVLEVIALASRLLLGEGASKNASGVGVLVQHREVSSLVLLFHKDLYLELPSEVI